MVGVRGFAGEISIGFTDFECEVKEGSKSEIFRRCDAGASEAQRRESRKSNGSGNLISEKSGEDCSRKFRLSTEIYPLFHPWWTDVFGLKSFSIHRNVRQ